MKKLRLKSPIATIPGISYRTGALILAEFGAFSSFDSPDKFLAFAGFSPLGKRGSRDLLYALYKETKYVCYLDSTFATYLAKKRAGGKHYNVAISHAAKN